MNPKILFVIDSLYPLGPAQQLRLLATRLEGFELHIAALSEPHDHGFTSQYPEVTLHGLGKGKIHGPKQAILARRIQKLVQSLNPKIVHAWCEPAFSPTALALRNFSNVRFIGTELSEQFEKPVVQWWLEERIHRDPETVIVPHQSLADQLKRNGLDWKFSVIPNAASANHRTPASARHLLVEKLGIPELSNIAVANAPLQARFRLKDLIWATDLLNCVRDDIHLAIFGSGSQEAQLRRFLSCTEAKGHVHFLGDDPNAHELMTGGDFYWHSHLKEPLASSLLHAMVHGVPAISVFGPNMDELLVSQTTALGVSYGARDEFARWSKYLIELPESAKQLARQGQAHVESNFAPESLVEEYLSIYG